MNAASLVAPSHSHAGTVIIALNSILLTLAALVMACCTTRQGADFSGWSSAVRNPNGWWKIQKAGSAMLFAGAMALSVQLLLVRLCFGKAEFGTVPRALDFGIKCSLEDNTWDNGTVSVCERNNAFDMTSTSGVVTSMGHFFQGVLVAWSMPIAEHFLVFLCFPKDATTLQYPRHYDILNFLKEVGCSCGAVYPVYNLFKRGFKGVQAQPGQSSFSGSSFCNNGAEWACGFLTGFSFAFFLTACVSSRGLNEHRRKCLNEHLLKAPLTWYRCVSYVLRFIMGLALFTACVWSGVLYGTTWHSDKAIRSGHGENGSSTMLALLLALPVFFWVVSTASVWCCTRKQHNGEDENVEKVSALLISWDSLARDGMFWEDGQSPKTLAKRP